VLEVLFSLVLVAGVALSVNIGTALIVGGVLGVLACEWKSALSRSERRT